MMINAMSKPTENSVLSAYAGDGVGGEAQCNWNRCLTDWRDPGDNGGMAGSFEQVVSDFGVHKATSKQTGR